MEEPHRAFAAFVFDLDGTLLDTLPDLVRLTNMVLDQQGWPQRTRDEILSYVGDGGRVLMRRAAPQSATDDQIADAFALWQSLYPRYGHELTCPYLGMTETLFQLKGKGAKLGVLSNKFDAAAREVVERHFPGVFDAVVGEGPETPRKPNPTGLFRMLADLGVAGEETAYVGDSGTDMEVAIAVGAFPVGVSWGYRPTEELEAAGARLVIDAPAQLLRSE